MWRNNPSPASIIGRREIEPLLFKACEATKSYEEATGTAAAVLDQAGRITGEERCAVTQKFCTLCRKYGQEPSTESSAPDGDSHLNNCNRLKNYQPEEGDVSSYAPAAPVGASCATLSTGGPAPRNAPGNGAFNGDLPCIKTHIAAAAHARRSGGVYIYMCEMGFMFWTAPLFANGHSPGALIAGGVLGAEKSVTTEKLRGLCGTGFPEAEKPLLHLQKKSRQQIKALAQMLLIQAEQLSRSTGDYRESAAQAGLSGSSKQLHLVRKAAAKSEEWPLDRERILLAALRRGDGDAWRKALNELLELIQKSAHYSFDSMRRRVVELTVLLSRAAMSTGKGWEPYGDIFGASGPVKIEPEGQSEESDGEILENNNRWLTRIQEAKSPEELANILRLIAERLSSHIFSFKGVRHASALRKAERFIWDNYTRKISLKEIAQASGLSGPYFSSIFKEEMGENLSNYLNRLRVERAMAMLSESDKSLNDIASACGFEDQSWFSKIFKSFAGVTPGKYREQGQGRFPAPTATAQQEAKDPGEWAIGPWAGSHFTAGQGTTNNTSYEGRTLPGRQQYRESKETG
jgi:AraC-like DNA-binding protein